MWCMCKFFFFSFGVGGDHHALKIWCSSIHARSERVEKIHWLANWNVKIKTFNMCPQMISDLLCKALFFVVSSILFDICRCRTLKEKDVLIKCVLVLRDFHQNMIDVHHLLELTHNIVTWMAITENVPHFWHQCYVNFFLSVLDKW